MTELRLHIAPGAERFNFVSHLLGALAAAVALVVLVARAEAPSATAAFAVYGTTLVLLFTASTVHHAVQTAAGEERSGIMRRLDHVSIFLFIAGSYTPVSVLAFDGAWRASILAIVWGVAALGIALKMFAPFLPRWTTVVIYICMGWIAIVAVKPLLEAFSNGALAWLLAGGIIYTVGAVGYATKRPDLWPQRVGFHGVWHVLVLVAAGLHLTFMLRFVPTA